jgi:2,4-dienoyl-CoA reductase-like NADH-dependent reductase (Old Yellow Enzyme family)
MRSNDPLLTSFQLRNLTIKNRIVSTAHAPGYSEQGMPKERYQLYHEEKAKGGIGMTMFGGSSGVSGDSPSGFSEQLDLANDAIIPYFSQFADRLHALDCALMCQITHIGRRTSWNQADWLPVIAPSRVREGVHRAFPKAMDSEDIRRVISDYAAAAKRCVAGGLDGVEVLSHGHLPDQFFSPLTNHRHDKYGGDIRGRMRFTLEVLEAVRKSVGPEFIVGIRIGIDEQSAGGYSKEEGFLAAEMIEGSGFVDYLNVVFGRIDTSYTLAHHIPGMWSRLAPWVDQVGELRRLTRLPIIHACRISDLSSARHAIEGGMMDLVGMTRAHIADPHIVRKLSEGREDTIRPCVGASYCLERLHFGREALCLHNPATGREASIPHVISKATGRPKKIVVVGGGPAGLEAARVSAERGHKVVLLEAAAKLGGQVLLAAKASWRRDLIGIVGWLEAEVIRLGADVRCNVFAGVQDINAENPDIVIIATGGVPDVDICEGSNLCHSVWDILSGVTVEGAVLLFDDNGSAQALSCADHMADYGNVSIELCTPDRAAGMEMGMQNFPIFMNNFYAKGVAVTPDVRLRRVERDGNRLKATLSNEYGGKEIIRIVDHVVIEHGTLPCDELFNELKESSVNGGTTDPSKLIRGEGQLDHFTEIGGFALFRVGDAVSSRDIHAAIYDSLRLCKDL